jgi:hypothetical protein
MAKWKGYETEGGLDWETRFRLSKERVPIRRYEVKIESGSRNTDEMSIN